MGAENWPHWRGPAANGISTEKNLPTKWSAAGTENILWKLPMPAMSGSTPIIWGDRIFLNVADALPDTGEKPSLNLWCVDKIKGTILWQRPLGGGNDMQRKSNRSAPSPVTDGTGVWVLTGTGILKGFDFNGTELWARDIQKDYGRFGLNWGYGSSPLLHGGALYVQVLHGMRTDDPSYLLRIDKTTGKTVWRVERPTQAIQESPDSYTTPAVVKVGNAEELVITGGDAVTGHDLATGKELWRVNGLNPTNNPNYRIVASPVVHGELIIAPTRVRPMLAMKPGGRGDVTGSHVLWSFDSGPDVPTPVTDGTLRVLVTDNGVMFCLDAKTGKEIYGRQRLRPGTYSGSLGARGRQAVHHQRRRRDDHRQGRPGVRDPGRERIQRLLAQLAGHLGRDDVLPHHEVPLGHRKQTMKLIVLVAVVVEPSIRPPSPLRRTP